MAPLALPTLATRFSIEHLKLSTYLETPSVYLDQLANRFRHQKLLLPSRLEECWRTPDLLFLLLSVADDFRKPSATE